MTFGDDEDSKIHLLDDDSDGDDLLSLLEGSNNEDLISLDEDVPDGLVEYDGSDEEAHTQDEEWGGSGGWFQQEMQIEGVTGAKRKKPRFLPTFASNEDYVTMIEDGRIC